VLERCRSVVRCGQNLLIAGPLDGANTGMGHHLCVLCPKKVPRVVGYNSVNLTDFQTFFTARKFFFEICCKRLAKYTLHTHTQYVGYTLHTYINHYKRRNAQTYKNDRPTFDWAEKVSPATHRNTLRSNKAVFRCRRNGWKDRPGRHCLGGRPVPAAASKLLSPSLLCVRGTDRCSDVI